MKLFASVSVTDARAVAMPFGNGAGESLTNVTDTSVLVAPGKLAAATMLTIPMAAIVLIFCQ